MTKPTPLTIVRSASVLEAMLQLNSSPITRTLVVTDDKGVVVGTLTDGDIRRFLCSSATHSTPQGAPPLASILVGDVMNSEPIVVRPGESQFQRITECHDRYKDGHREIRILPVVDDEGKLQDVLDLMSGRPRTRLEVVLMARAKLVGIASSPGVGEYHAALTHQSFAARRARYDTIRYAFEREKYAVLSELMRSELELSAILQHRRIDEVYMALTRGEQWSHSCTPPDRSLKNGLATLSSHLGRAKTDLMLAYLRKARSSEFIGDREASEEADVVFVLGCTGEATLASRVRKCVDFLQTKSRKRLPKAVVLSGGGVDANATEAERMLEMLKSELTDLDHLLSSGNLKVLLENDSLDTVGNAVLGQLTLIREGLYAPQRKSTRGDRLRLLVFTTDFHAHRALGLFQRVFSDAYVAVRSSMSEQNQLEPLAREAGHQLESESVANTQTFSLDNAVTGAPQSIADGHVQSVFYQFLRHHKLYRSRPDLIRKYRDVLMMLSGATGAGADGRRKQRIRR